nr:hypothetical protein [uncultured Tyzzerella sp.]
MANKLKANIKNLNKKQQKLLSDYINEKVKNKVPLDKIEARVYRDVCSKEIAVEKSGHHVPAVRKSKGRKFEVKRSDKTRPTIFPKGEDPDHDHWRMHDAEKDYVGSRQGDFKGSNDELFEAYRKSYKDLDDMLVDVKSPNGKYILGENISLLEAIDVIQKWLKEQGLY